MNRPKLEAVAELQDHEIQGFKRDVGEITISTTTVITTTPIDSKPGLSLVTISVDKEIDGDLLRASLKDGLLQHWGWGEKFKVQE